MTNGKHSQTATTTPSPRTTKAGKRSVSPTLPLLNTYDYFYDYKSDFSRVKQKQNKQKLHIQDQYQILIGDRNHRYHTQNGKEKNCAKNHTSTTAVLEVTRACWTDCTEIPVTDPLNGYCSKKFTEKQAKMIQVDFVRVLTMIPSQETAFTEGHLKTRNTLVLHRGSEKQNAPVPRQWDSTGLLETTGRYSEYRCEHCAYVSQYMDQLLEHSYRLHGEKASIRLERKMFAHIFQSSPSSPAVEFPITGRISRARSIVRSREINSGCLTLSDSPSLSRKINPQFFGTHSWSGCALMHTHSRSGKIA